MIKSRCHRASVDVFSYNEGMSFYVCSYCKVSCDTIDYGYHKERCYDTGREAEIKGIIATA